jgi:hypothetical protein
MGVSAVSVRIQFSCVLLCGHYSQILVNLDEGLIHD